MRIEIKSVDGKIIHFLELENITIKDAVEDAVSKGVELKEANLPGANLKGAYLKGAMLKDANLVGANLEATNLKGAILEDANLVGANLEWANLEYANLYSANLRGAYLYGADLKCACLICVNLVGANLKDANLEDANLVDSDLKYADLNCANLKNTNLRDAYLYGVDFGEAILEGTKLEGSNIQAAILESAKLNINLNVHLPLACPSDGEFVAWKKVCGCLIKLKVPADARRCSATTNKCRCDKAKVLEITIAETGEKVKEVLNFAFTPLLYRVGEMVYPDSYDENRWNECSHGIHFFIDKKEALKY